MTTINLKDFYSWYTHDEYIEVSDEVAAEHGSGLTLDRPALHELTEAVLAGKVDVVLVNSLDRLGRDWGMTKQYIDLLTEHKVKLLCVRERMMIDSSSFSPFFT